jgi:DNA-binding response OmpR family regulator
MHQAPRSPAQPQERPAPLTGLAQRPVVLVVDDDAAVREALHLVLDEDYSVLDAAHGRTAVGIVAAKRVDVVLLDILMPDIDGIEILQELKALKPDLAVIMLTAVKTVRTSVAAMKLGAWDYLTKPFHEEEVLGTIRRAFDHRSWHPNIPMESPAQHHKAGSNPAPRLLVVGGGLGWRATLQVLLARGSVVQTTACLIEGLSRLLRFRPNAVLLNVGRSSTEAAPFLRALNAQLPACPVLVISNDGYLGGVSDTWQTLNIRDVMQPPIGLAVLLRRISLLLSLDVDGNRSWSQPGSSVGRVLDHISAHFDDDLTVERLAQMAEISASHFAHLFRAEVGLSVRSYLTRVRVAIVQDLLASSDDKLDAIAARVGFADRFHLCRVFQRVTGRRPGAFRRHANLRAL